MKEKRTPSFAYSLLTLFSLVIFLVVGMRVWGAPLNVIMFLAWMLLSLLALKLGYTYSELEGKALGAVHNGLKSIVIMLAVGTLIAVFTASGTVPTIIYYGIKIMNPKYYLLKMHHTMFSSFIVRQEPLGGLWELLVLLYYVLVEALAFLLEPQVQLFLVLGLETSFLHFLIQLTLHLQ